VHLSKEFKIGLFSVIAITLLYLGFNFLKGIDFLATTNKYYTVYENIGGLQVSNSVIIKGFAVGRVSNITYDQERGNKIVVELDINGNILLDDSTIAVLVSEGFLGGKAIELKMPPVIQNPIEGGDTLRSEIALDIFESLTEQTGPVADDIGALIRQLNVELENFHETELLLRETIEKINSNLDQTYLMIKENRENFKVTLENLNGLTLNLKDASTELKPLLMDADVFIDSLNNLELSSTLESMSNSMDNLNLLLKNLNEGEGSMGKLLHDDSLYYYLTRTAADLDSLFIDLRENPERYVQVSVFGKKDKTEKNKKKEERRKARSEKE
jgi:phospholipid/cholesterol/gamma-HCH transport system substrate-binding protein